jgi:hypothetical protein
MCNNLDPRGHASSVYQSDSLKGGTTSLTLVLDALSLSRTKLPAERGCRFCYVLIQALDAFFDDWRGSRQQITINIREKGSIKVGINGARWEGELIEIFSGAGRDCLSPLVSQIIMFYHHVLSRRFLANFSSTSLDLMEIIDITGINENCVASRAPWSTLGTAHRIPTDAGSDRTFDFARQCIQDCLTNTKHIACKPPSKSVSVLPKRLLDVGRVNAPIRLIDTQGRPFKYATLSHCWGTGSVLTATKANWHKLASNILFTALPPLFQDAIIVTRQLGLRYIWIDSLCIIQDSTRDWETESSKMGGIYENSYITISATNCGDSKTRCLVDRRKPIKIMYKRITGKEFVIGARKVEDHHPDAKEAIPAKLMGPLTLRAWVLQEHVLSTRILHYTATELLFECKTSFRCESLPSRKSHPTTPSLIPKAIARKNSTFEAIWDAWQHVVAQYSQRELTIPSDKLPAISGIASKIKDATGSQYVAGLWKDNLASDLLWSATPKGSPNRPVYALDTYRAPTFSWASLNVPILYYTPDTDERKTFRPTITQPSPKTVLAGLNVLGSVSDASLRLSGPCLSAHLCSSPQKDGTCDYTLLIKGTSAIRISHDCILIEVTENATTPLKAKTVQRAQIGGSLSQFTAPVMCLCVMRYDAWISGLVLGLSTRVSGAYERLGTFAAGMEGFYEADERDIILV